MEYTEEQRTAVEAPDGLVIVASGAGTGKTTVLTGRFRELVRRGADPRSILALTFTRDAAREMKTRLADISCDNIRTLHSLSAAILIKAARLGVIRKWTLMTQSDCRELLEKIMLEKNVVIPDGEGGDSFFNEHLSTIDKWQENGLTLEDAMSVDRSSFGCRAWLVDVFEAFEACKREHGLMSYGDMSKEAVRVGRQHPELAGEIFGHITNVLVDEAQDLSLGQVDMVEMLSSRSGNLFVVGDDDQSLYGFRGSVPRLMERLEELFPVPAARGVTRTSLTLNRRCTRQMLVPANMIVSHTRRSSPKVLEGMRDGPPVETLAYYSDTAQLREIAARIASGVEAGNDPADYAILARTRKALVNVEMALRKARLPVDVHCGVKFAERSEVSDVLAYLNLAVRPECVQSFSRILARPTRGLGAVALNAIVDNLDGRSFYEAVSALSASEAFSDKARREMRKLSGLLQKIHLGYTSSCTSLTLLQAILLEGGYEKWTNTANKATAKASLESLRVLAGELPKLDDFLAELQTMRDTDLPAGEGVYIGSLHASKGREWPHVVIVGMENGVFPLPSTLGGSRVHERSSRWDITSGTDIDEERRMLHVGMTRAKETLALSHSFHRKSGKRVKVLTPSSFYFEAGFNPSVTPPRKTIGL